jgi:hypothetical protein
MFICVMVLQVILINLARINSRFFNGLSQAERKLPSGMRVAQLHAEPLQAIPTRLIDAAATRETPIGRLIERLSSECEKLSAEVCEKRLIFAQLEDRRRHSPTAAECEKESSASRKKKCSSRQ